MKHHHCNHFLRQIHFLQPIQAFNKSPFPSSDHSIKTPSRLVFLLPSRQPCHRLLPLRAQRAGACLLLFSASSPSSTKPFPSRLHFSTEASTDLRRHPTAAIRRTSTSSWRDHLLPQLSCAALELSIGARSRPALLISHGLGILSPGAASLRSLSSSGTSSAPLPSTPSRPSRFHFLSRSFADPVHGAAARLCLNDRAVFPFLSGAATNPQHHGPCRSHSGPPSQLPSSPPRAASSVCHRPAAAKAERPSTFSGSGRRFLSDPRHSCHRRSEQLLRQALTPAAGNCCVHPAVHPVCAEIAMRTRQRTRLFIQSAPGGALFDFGFTATIFIHFWSDFGNDFSLSSPLFSLKHCFFLVSCVIACTEILIH